MFEKRLIFLSMANQKNLIVYRFGILKEVLSPHPPLNSFGVIPVCFLNHRLKCCG